MCRNLETAPTGIITREFCRLRRGGSKQQPLLSAVLPTVRAIRFVLCRVRTGRARLLFRLRAVGQDKTQLTIARPQSISPRRPLGMSSIKLRALRHEGVSQPSSFIKIALSRHFLERTLLKNVLFDAWTGMETKQRLMVSPFCSVLKQNFFWSRWIRSGRCGIPISGSVH